jgi:hypothetical protein
MKEFVYSILCKLTSIAYIDGWAEQAAIYVRNNWLKLNCEGQPIGK